MDRAVVDASVAIKWVYSEDLSDQAQEARKRLGLIAPDLMLAECANILWKKVRRDEMTSEEARFSIAALRRSQIDLVPIADLSGHALELSIELDHPAYDCFYLALCRRENLPLITADDRLVRKLQSSALRLPKMISLRSIA